jgi:hypothetical protein
MDRPVTEVLPSAWWASARVIVLECGHRHVRPESIAPQPGGTFPCYFCDDDPPASISSLPIRDKKI